MRFAFDEEQLAFAATVGALLEKQCPPEAVRAAWTGELDRGVWSALAEMGVLSLLVPEADGGLGLDERSLVLLLEESGYAGLPHPLVETAAVAMPLVAGRVAPDAVIASDLGGSVVPCAGDADWLLLRDGDALHLVQPADVVLHPVDTVDGARRAAEVEWTVSETTPVGGDLGLAVQRGALGTAAQLVGLGRRMVDLTVAYVTDREQFGVPIGSFQAVKHHLADAAKELAFARPVVHRAAWSLATGAPTVGRDVSMAKAMASEAALVAGRVALQCHGAIGYTVEHDLHLYLKRSWALARACGDAAHHRARVAESLGV
jgi:alkylation response protein AidB-like acyl-CoA dehydrogenase